MLTSSSGTNHVLNKHEEFDQYGSIAMPSEIIPFYSYPASLVNQKPCCNIVLTSSSDINHVPNEHEDVDQYVPYAIPSEIMSC